MDIYDAIKNFFLNVSQESLANHIASIEKQYVAFLKENPELKSNFLNFMVFNASFLNVMIVNQVPPDKRKDTIDAYYCILKKIHHPFLHAVPSNKDNKHETH